MEETDDLVGAGPRAGPYSDAYVDPSVLVLAMTGAVGRIVELRADHHTGPRVLPGSGDWLRLAGDRNEPRPPDRQPDDPVSLTTEVEGGVLVASVDDGKANALTFDLVDGLRAAVASAVGQGQPLLVTGRDGCFSAGFDLAVMNGDDQERAAALFAAGAILYREIIEAPVPVVASCTGHALAGGAILLLCADHRIGRSGPYKVGLNEVGIGMALPAFAVSIATHRLERRYLTSAAMFAEIGDPERAAAMGFLDEVVADPFPRALSFAAALAQLPHEAFAATKRRIRWGLTQELTALEG